MRITPMRWTRFTLVDDVIMCGKQLLTGVICISS